MTMMTKFAQPQSRRTIRTFAVLSAIALLFGSAAALADSASGQAKPDADHGPHHGRGNGARLFEHWDKDHDGRINIADLPSRMQQHIRTIDLNKDGVLTREEFDKGKSQLQALREKEMDRNGDGKVSDEERRETMRAGLVARFVEQDKNHDGALTESEVGKEHWEHIKVADANSDSKVTLDELKTAFDEGKLRPPGRRGPGGEPKTEAEMKAHAQQRFNADDKNHDGFLTENEIPGRWAHLKVADANQDNKITFDELTAAFKAGKLGHPRHDRQGHDK
jgi:Ca2+-binding EF-hand superfamily protein